MILKPWDSNYGTETKLKYNTFVWGRCFLSIFILTLLLLFSSPVYSLDTSFEALEKYTKKISNKFTRTYCNTTKFGISYEGALAFAIGETNKEFKNNKLNKLIDYSLLKNSIVNDLENNCQVYNFDISNLENLKFN